MNYFAQAFWRTEKCCEENLLFVHEVFPHGVFQGLQELGNGATVLGEMWGNAWSTGDTVTRWLDYVQRLSGGVKACRCGREKLRKCRKKGVC